MPATNHNSSHAIEILIQGSWTIDLYVNTYERSIDLATEYAVFMPTRVRRLSDGMIVWSTED